MGNIKLKPDDPGITFTQDHHISTRSDRQCLNARHRNQNMSGVYRAFHSWANMSDDDWDKTLMGCCFFDKHKGEASPDTIQPMDKSTDKDVHQYRRAVMTTDIKWDGIITTPFVKCKDDNNAMAKSMDEDTNISDGINDPLTAIRGNNYYPYDEVVPDPEDQHSR